MFLRRKSYIKNILKDRYEKQSELVRSKIFKPANIALIKYWGKRCNILNLPLVSSLSYSFNNLGTFTSISTDSDKDIIIFNDNLLPVEDYKAQKIIEFLDLFRKEGEYFYIETTNNIPTSSGLASSASGFAALTAALNLLQEWKLNEVELSLIARLGSGSACRSFVNGIAFWDKGCRGKMGLIVLLFSLLTLSHLKWR
ncbi:MAG: hypothetical protein RCG15_00355 [Candidatus Rickettsia vulgarisii]